MVLVYVKLRAPVCRVKNVKAKWGYIKEKRSCRNMFIESSKELRFKTVALNDFFFFMFFTTYILLSYKQKYRADRHCEGAETFKKDLALY